MNYLKKIGKGYIYTFSILIIATFIFSCLYYINLIGNKVLTVIKIIIPIISLFVGSKIVGKKSTKKGWLEGLKYGGIFVLFLLLFNYLVLRNNLEVKSIIYYLILLASSVFGGMLGISIDKEKK